MMMRRGCHWSLNTAHASQHIPWRSLLILSSLVLEIFQVYLLFMFYSRQWATVLRETQFFNIENTKLVYWDNQPFLKKKKTKQRSSPSCRSTSGTVSFLRHSAAQIDHGTQDSVLFCHFGCCCCWLPSELYGTDQMNRSGLPMMPGEIRNSPSSHSVVFRVSCFFRERKRIRTPLTSDSKRKRKSYATSFLSYNFIHNF